MGEAVYYGRVKFESPEKAEEALPKIEEFLKMMRDAEDRWQALRGSQKNDEKLRIEFQEVFELLKLDRPVDEDGPFENSYMNYLAGELDSPYERECSELIVYGDSVVFCGFVWHLADWSRLMRGLKDRFGAIDAGWISDENVGNEVYYDSLCREVVVT